MNSFKTKAEGITLSTEGFHAKTQSLNHLVHCNKLYPTRIYFKYSVAFKKLLLYIVINNAVSAGNIHWSYCRFSLTDSKTLCNCHLQYNKGKQSKPCFVTFRLH